MKRAFALPLLGLLAACSSEKTPEPAPSPTPTMAEPRTLIAADFDPASLGARVAGMDVTDAPIGDAGEPLARLTAYVACAKEVAVCDPAKLPEDTVYTYVLTIKRSAVQASDSRTGSAAPAAIIPIPPTLAMIDVATGFEGAVGYSLSEARDALGAEDALSITLTQGRLAWRVTGGDVWKPEKAITFWWQSTRPPAPPSPAYHLVFWTDTPDSVNAPFPVADKPVDGERER